jgi:zinc protease
MRVLQRWIGLFACLLIASAMSTSVAQAQVPLKKTLPNGLTVLVLENHAAPVVAVRAYVRTGSIYEGQHLGSGISHLFEHTLFEGTKTRSKEQMNDAIQAIGGQSNAYTSKDVTAYHLTTASNYLPQALDILADMLQNATFPEAEVKTQIGVIHNEMNLGEDDPDREIYEIFNETAFKTHPVRYPIIGYREIFDRITRDDILNYYKTHYTPSNTVFAVAGDVSAPRVFALVAEAFKNWERRSPQTPTLPSEPLQTTPRRAVVDKDVQLTYLMMGWHTVPLQHPDLYPLDVLAEILGGNESSRLVRELREKQNLVSSISAYSATPNYNAGIFGVRATMPPQNLPRIEQAVMEQIYKLQREGVTEAELSRAKRQIESSFVFNNTNVEDQAEQMAYDELGTGDPSYSRRYVARIKAVTAPQVLEIARKYFSGESLTTAIVRPRAAARAASVPAAVAPAEPATKPAQLVRLPNGMRLIIRENHSTPTVSIVAMGMAGTRLEPAAKAGVANLAARMLTRGTDKRNFEELSALVDDLGGELSAFSGYNSWGIQSQWLSRDWRKGLSLVRESMLSPAFPQEELTRVKAQVAAQLAEQQDDPNSAAALLLRKTFYGNSPYGRSSLGNPAALEKISREDLQKFWNAVLYPRSTVLAIYGDIDAEEVKRAVAYDFRNFQREGRLPIAPPASPELTQFTMTEQAKPGLAQAALWFGYPSITIDNPDRYAIDVLDAALSGSSLPGGRLHARLRDNQLVYVVHAYNQPALEPGMFVIYAATTAEKREQVQNIIEEEVQKVRNTDISEEELSRAKSMAIAAHAIDNQSNAAQAQNSASNELFGLGYNEDIRYGAGVSRVTLEDVRRVAQKYLRPEAAALAVVAPQQAATESPAPAVEQPVS